MIKVVAGWDLVTRVRAVLGVIALLFLAYLLFSDKPWSVVVPEGRTMKVAQFVTIYGWAAAAINLVLTLVLAATSPLWLNPKPTAPRTFRVTPPRWFWPLVLIAMALGAWSGFPRLEQGLWHDEGYPLRRAILGEYRTNPDGSLKLKETKWLDAFFFYSKPNHVPHSVLVKASNDTWRFFAKPEGLQFNETAIRLPTYLAGIVAIGALALLLGRMGFFAGGVTAAFIAALHPWMLRYGTEARAYAFVLFLVPLLFYFALRLLNHGTWKWWGAYAAGQFLLLYFYPTTVFVLVVLNLCLPVALWWQWRGTKQFVPQMGRWVAANIFAAMVYLQFMLACIPQFLNYLDETYTLGDVDFRWTQNALAHMLSGTSWNYSLKFDSPYVELMPWAVHHPGLFVLVVFLAIAALVLGILALARRNKTFGLLTLPMILPAVLCYIEARVRNGHMFEWYIIFILPGLIMLVAVGLSLPFEAARGRFSKSVAVAWLLLVLVSFAVWTEPKRAVLRSAGMQPNRESVLLTRPSLNPHDPRQKEILTATFFGRPDPYDPHIRFVTGNQGLEDVVREADSAGKPLFINLGYLPTVEGEHTNKYKFLLKSGFFEDLGRMHGNEPIQARHVFKYLPGSAKDFDFSSIPVDRGSPGRAEQ
ncbi:MAG: glycosyltransferase family 39 protein [Terrimicrobiaceae bacterium]